MHKYTLFLFLIIISCNERKDELPVIEKINHITENSKLTLEEKYDSIYKSGLLNHSDLTLEEKVKIGNLFFTTSSEVQFTAPAINIEVLPDGKLSLYIRGHLKSKFKERKFDNYRFNVFTTITIGEKSFTSGQIFRYNNEEFDELNFELHQKLINDIEAVSGEKDFVWLDKSYLKYKPKQCLCSIELVAENKVGEKCSIALYSEDFSHLWDDNSMYLYYR